MVPLTQEFNTRIVYISLNIYIYISIKVREVRHILLNCSETNHFSKNFYSLCVNYATCKGTCRILFFYDHYLMSDWGTNKITHTFIADSSPGWMCSPLMPLMTEISGTFFIFIYYHITYSVLRNNVYSWQS